jgi:hypothetical protein
VLPKSPKLLRGRWLVWHRRTLRQDDFPVSVLFGEDPKEPVFSAERFSFIRAVDGHVFGQDGHVPVRIKLHVRFARVEHLQRAVGPLQIFKLSRLVEQFPLRIQSEKIIRQYFIQKCRVPILFRLDIAVSERDDFLNGLVVLGRRRLGLSEQGHSKNNCQCYDVCNFHETTSHLNISTQSLKGVLKALYQVKGRRKNWCRRRESNPHGLATNGF